MAEVFISYASRDRERASAIAHFLADQGFTVWWDRELVAGADFGPEIEPQIEQSRAVVVLWSAAARRSQWVRDEAACARDRHKLVPLRLDDSEPPLGFRQLQTLDISAWNGDPSDGVLGPVAVALRRVLGRPAPDPGPASAGNKSVLKSPTIRYVFLGAILLLATGAIVGWVAPWDSPEADRAASSPVADAESGVDRNFVQPDLSIAVLPFADLSEAQDQAYFADGMSEEVQGLLTNVTRLRVIGRTSAFQFKGKSEDLRTIGTMRRVSLQQNATFSRR